VEIVGHEKGFADPYGHGTHVAGIIAGDGTSSSDPRSFRRFNGIAPRARIVSVRVLDGNGSGRVSDVLSGIDWVLSHHDEYGIRVLNLSLGHPVEESSMTDPLCRAVEAVWKAGILVVAAAGNAGAEGSASIHSPGNDATILTVGASNNYQTGSRFDDILTSYSSRGPTLLDHVVKPDLVAPGNRTLSLRVAGSTLDEAYPSLRVKQGLFRDDPASSDQDSPYFQMSGSSMAAGVVSGMAALMLQADPSLTPDTLKARLMKSAEKRLVYDLFSEGAGFADLHAALGEEGTALSEALSPRVQWTEAGLVLEGSGTLWLQSSAFDLVKVYGAEPFRGTGSVWADSWIWSDSSSESFPASVSGHSVIWGGGRKTSGSGGPSSTTSDSVIWGGGLENSGNSSIGADSVIWGGGRKGSGTTSGSTAVSADSVIWGGGLKTTTDTTLGGDNNPPQI
ncbi:MAG: S8 family serine peptidase, partial [Acidobacteria bacterium]|nr:S8 family serine peptidase [Acidobacteriota bacterium]